MPMEPELLMFDIASELERGHPRTRQLVPKSEDHGGERVAILAQDVRLKHCAAHRHDRIRDAAEIRLRAAKFGATVEDRNRLRMTVRVPGEAEGPAPQRLAPVTDLHARRRRLTE
ncbi:phage terminase small subunit [Glycomyces terrestris]